MQSMTTVEDPRFNPAQMEPVPQEGEPLPEGMTLRDAISDANARNRARQRNNNVLTAAELEALTAQRIEARRGGASK